MFLQWMISQRVKLPVLKGAVLLVCYYVGSGVLAATLVGPERMGQMLRWLTPISGDPTHLADVSVVAGGGDAGASAGDCGDCWRVGCSARCNAQRSSRGYGERLKRLRHEDKARSEDRALCVMRSQVD